MNILIIDDDRFITKALSNFLGSQGYNVDVINKSTEVLRALEKVEAYDCVLLDLMMRKPEGLDAKKGEETGEAIFKKIKSKNIPVVIITGKDFSEIKTDFKKYGARVLLKPFNSRFSDIHEAVRNV